MTLVTDMVNSLGMLNKIQEVMDQRGLKTEELALRMGTSIATVSRLKNEKRGLTLAWLKKFATALDCRITDLIIETVAVEDVPKEEIKRWIDRWWANVGDKQRNWFDAEMERLFPEFEAWKKKFQTHEDVGNVAQKKSTA